MAETHIWDKGYDYGGGFYIHLHQKHIGAMLTHKPASQDSLIKTFTRQKEKARKAIKTQYKELFLANVDPDSYTALEELFEDNGNIQLIDKALKSAFEEGLNSQAAQKIIDAQRKIDWPTLNVQDKLTENSQVWEGFDSLLEGLAKGVSLINSTDGRAIAALIRNEKSSKHGGAQRTIYEVGSNLSKALDKKIEELTQGNKRQTISRKNLIQALYALNTLANRLKTADKSGKIKSERKKEDDPITIQYLKDSVNRNFFSTILGESASTLWNSAAAQTAGVEIDKSVKSIHSTGKDTVKFIPSNRSGGYGGNTGGESSLKQGKADVKFENVQLSLESILGKEGAGKVTLSIGISNKAYKNLSLKDNGDITSDSLVTGGSVKVDTIFDMLTNSSRIKYLGYNILAWTSKSAPSQYKEGAFDLTPALLSVQDALFTRSTLHIFAARGKTDFSNFMFINGQLISMLDIIESVISKNDIATTSTMAKSGQGVIFSLKGRGSLWKSVGKDNYENAKTRSSKLTEAISNSRIEGHINPFAF